MSGYIFAAVVFVGLAIGGSSHYFYLIAMVITVLGGLTHAFLGDLLVVKIIKAKYLTAVFSVSAVLLGERELGQWTGWFATPSWASGDGALFSAILLSLVFLFVGFNGRFGETQNEKEEKRKLAKALREPNPWPTYAGQDRRRVVKR